MVLTELLVYGACVILNPKTMHPDVKREHEFFTCKQEGQLYDYNGGYYSTHFSCITGNRSFLISREEILAVIECKEKDDE